MIILKEASVWECVPWRCFFLFKIVNIIIKSGENGNKNSKNVENIWCSIYNGNTHIERGGKSV